MNKVSQLWANFVISFRWPIIAFTLLLMAIAPLSFDRLYFDNSNEAYFIENDPNLIAFDNLLERFGDTEYLVVGIPGLQGEQDVFNASTITMIHELTQFLEDHEHVTQVRSLSKYQFTHDDGGLLATDDLFEDIEEIAGDSQALDDAREIMAGEKLALGNLITDDFQHTRIAARVEYIKNENAHNVKLVSDLQNYIAEKGYREQGHVLHLSGIPVIAERFETLTQKDQAILNPAMGVVMLIILFFVFRSFFATLTPIVIIVATLFLLTSVQGILAFPTTAVNSALIPTMIILAMGACVHVLVEFFQERRKGHGPKEAAQITTRDLLLPILFTSLTTAFGFIALSITELRPVREFAILAAVGPMIIFLLTTTTLPAILSFIPWIARQNHSNALGENTHTLTYRVTSKLADFNWNKRHIIAVSGVLVTLFSLYSIQHIRVDANVVNYFKPNSWINADLHYFNDKFKGIANLEVIIDTKEDGGVKNPQVLQRADSLQNWLETLSETGQAVSIVDFYKQINQSLNEDDEAFYKLPTSKAMAAQFLLLYENTGPEEDLSDLKDFNEHYLRISVPTINMDETKTTELLERIESGIAANYSDLDLELTGSLVMNNAQNVYVNNGMFQSFGIAILVIGASFIVLFRSFKYGVIALIPSLVPILLTGGLISYYGISLDLGTMIVGAMTIGIAVDDSIHLMSRYLLGRRRGLAVHDAIDLAMHSSGRAVILTSVILVTGFSVMLFGSFMPFIYVGLFSAMIMTFALIGDLIFMPGLLYLVDRGNRFATTKNDTKFVISNSGVNKNA